MTQNIGKDCMPKIIDTDSLFRTTVQLFAQRGYEATTTLEIARLAGVNEATLYRRYGSKPNLIGEALHHCLAQSPFAKLRASDDTKADLLAIVTAYQETFQAFGGAVMTLMIELSRNEELQGATAAFMPNFLNAAQIIAVHQDSGKLNAGHPVQVLSILIAPMMVSGLMGRSKADLNIPPFSAESVVTGFLNGHQANR
jgi:AcrR family transcriptional regulator